MTKKILNSSGNMPFSLNALIRESIPVEHFIEMNNFEVVEKMRYEEIQDNKTFTFCGIYEGHCNNCSHAG